MHLLRVPLRPVPKGSKIPQKLQQKNIQKHKQNNQHIIFHIIFCRFHRFSVVFVDFRIVFVDFRPFSTIFEEFLLIFWLLRNGGPQAWVARPSDAVAYWKSSHPKNNSWRVAKRVLLNRFSRGGCRPPGPPHNDPPTNRQKSMKIWRFFMIFRWGPCPGALLQGFWRGGAQPPGCFLDIYVNSICCRLPARWSVLFLTHGTSEPLPGKKSKRSCCWRKYLFSWS